MEAPQNNRLFVYGIFLGETLRDAYGMTNPQYETVPGYITVGGTIVEAIPVKNESIRLTGLVVDVNPNQWDHIDNLERHYDKVLVTTTSGEVVNMYVGKPRVQEGA